MRADVLKIMHAFWEDIVHDLVGRCFSGTDADVDGDDGDGLNLPDSRIDVVVVVVVVIAAEHAPLSRRRCVLKCDH